MADLYGLIPAAGKGTRARPYTRDIHKGMLEINGRPNLERVIGTMRDEMGISEIVIVIGHLGDTIREHFGDGSQLGVKLHYVENTELDRGLAYSVYLGSRVLDGYACVLLCDECYVNSNHSELLEFPYRDYLVTCGAVQVADRDRIKKNYAVYHEGIRISRLVEKPTRVDNNLMGSGTFVCSPELTPLLGKAFEESESGYVEFVTLIDSLCRPDSQVAFFELTGTYVNINDRDSLQLAKFHDRRRDFDNNQVDLLICSEGDEEDVAHTISRYRQISAIDNFYVVLPEENSVEEKIADSGVTVIKCPTGCTLFGEKLKHAAQQTSGDIIIFTEADYSFPSRDVSKLLTYVREADMVIGTRTTRQLIEQGSTMRGLVRMANISLGKLLELLWWNRESRFTDVGCTFRAVWRPVLDRVFDRLTARGPGFLADMVIEVLADRDRVIEVPVNYYNRSKSLNRAHRHPSTAWTFLSLILSKRIKYLFKR